MITSLFRKSTPLNYSLVVLGLLFFFMEAQFYTFKTIPTNLSYTLVGWLLVLLYAALFITNFIAKKNALSKDSAYTVLFYVLFLAVFPAVFTQPKLVCAQFFILLSTRRLISLHTMKASKEKIFDASLWVFIASLFYFWSILFLALVYISILFHTARDYRTWFLPVLAFVAVAALFLLFDHVLHTNWVENLQHQAYYNTNIAFELTHPSSVVLVCYLSAGILAMLALMITLTNKPLLLHSSYKKVICAFAIGGLIYAVAPVKTNEILLFTTTPFAIVFTSHIEAMSSKWQKEMLLISVLLLSCMAFFIQL